MKTTRKNYFIAVNGLMGSGKSTFAKILAKEFKAKLFKEQFQKNHFLPLYYNNPQRWVLPCQLFFLSETIDQLHKIKNLLPAANIIQDTPIYQNHFAYVSTQKALGYLNAKEHKLYSRIFNSLHKNVPKPDLIVNLDIPFSDLQKRIKLRGRNYEKSINLKYLKTLYRMQNKWIKNTPDLNIIQIKVDNGDRDLLFNENYKKETIKKIWLALANKPYES